MERALVIIVLAVVAAAQPVKSQTSDFGMWYELGAEKKLSKKWTVGAEGEFRTRNDSRTADRWSASLSADYKIVKGLKVSAGYTFLYDNNEENFDLKKDGFTPNKWRPSYWGVRHRFNVSLAGSVDWGRLSIGLRERWQYTYRPEVTGKKYDFDDTQWESVKSKSKNMLRSRLQLSYDIPRWKLDPFANAEMFSDGNGIQKMRYQAGFEYKLMKKHVFSLTYRYQDVNSGDDDEEVNGHLIGLGYKFKF